jgi:hypothetical protein
MTTDIKQDSTESRVVNTRGHQPDWRPLLEHDAAMWQSAKAAAAKGPRILVATSVGGHMPGTILESVLAVALTLRGANVHLLLCDKVLPACLLAAVPVVRDPELFATEGPQACLCDRCFDGAFDMYSSFGLPVHRYSGLIPPKSIAETETLADTISSAGIRTFELENISIGEHAMAGALRYYARGDLDNEPRGETVLRRYLKSALYTADACNTLFDAYRFDSVCLHHGIYAPQGIIAAVARQRNLRLATWNPAYRKKCFIFSHGETYHHSLLAEPVSSWEDIVWNEEMEEQVMDYLRSRWHGTRDWIWFHEEPHDDVKTLAGELGIDLSKPCIGLLTNVIWDAQLHYRANAFSSMMEWLLATVRYFERRPDLQLIVRVHPAEIRGGNPSRQLVVDELNQAFPSLPPNVFIISPDNPISTYALMSRCCPVIIYGTKTGVELTSMGIPVIVAGEAWIRNKGLTTDAVSPEDYFRILDSLPSSAKLDARTVTRARKYAYHFFFRRMVPIRCIEPFSNPHFQIQLSSLHDLLPGRDPGLDVICDGILTGSDFFYQGESLS